MRDRLLRCGTIYEGAPKACNRRRGLANLCERSDTCSIHEAACSPF
jgi:hypothetical protein